LVHTVNYRIAFIAFVLETSKNGFALCRYLKTSASWNPWYIQFGSAGWFWDQSVNTYQIQVLWNKKNSRIAWGIFNGVEKRGEYEDVTKYLWDEGRGIFC